LSTLPCSATSTGEGAMTYDGFLRSMRDLGGEEADGTSGNIEVRLTLPDNSELHGKFPDFVPVAAIFAFALASPWGRKARPAGIRLTEKASRRELGSSEVISRDLHRAAIVVSVGTPSASAAPAAGVTAGVAAPGLRQGSEEAVAEEAPPVAGAPTGEAAQNERSTSPAISGGEGGIDEQGVTYLMNTTGVDRGPAVSTLQACGGQAEVAANRLLDGLSTTPASVPPATQARAAVQTATATRPPVDGAKILAVVQRTGASYEAARSALDATGWDVDAGARKVQEARNEAQAALQQRRTGEAAAPQRRRQDEFSLFNVPEGRRRSSPGSSCGLDGEIPHLILGLVLGGLSACAVGICASV